MIEKEEIKLEDVDKAVTWWSKNKGWVWGAILLIVGGLGGNVDRVADLLPTLECDCECCVEQEEETPTITPPEEPKASLEVELR